MCGCSQDGKNRIRSAMYDETNLDVLALTETIFIEKRVEWLGNIQVLKFKVSMIAKAKDRVALLK